MSPQEKVELGIRAAHLAKSALDMLGTGDRYLAKLQFQQVIQDVKELDEFLRKAGGERG